MSRERWLQETVSGARIAALSGKINAAGAVAHAANETGYGSSQLGKPPHHNLFGVKATGAWRGRTVDLPTWEVINGKRVDIVASWRSYESYTECFEDYGDIISRLYPYADPRHPISFLRGLFLTGPRRWATDPLAFNKAAVILGEWWDILDPPMTSGEATRFVLHHFHRRDVLALLDAHLQHESQLVLKGEFVTRYVRDEAGGRVDVRRKV